MKRHITDALELMVAKTLDDKGIEYLHESERGESGVKLDFYLPKADVYIEVKRFHSERTNYQLESKENVILIQGLQAVKVFNRLLTDSTPF